MPLDSRPHPIFAIAIAAVILSSCQAEGAEETRYIEFLGIRLGEVWPGSEEKLYSQANEELIIRDFFENRKGGVFLDVGCSTPIDYSTTYYLEKHLGWSGIGVDALREYAPQYKTHRPKTKFFSYFVTDQSKTRQDFYRVIGADGLSSGNKDGPMIKNMHKVKRRVPTITLNELLEQNNVTSIDFMSMDIEGGAPKALAGFDIEKYQPKLICIEAGGQESFIETYFAEHNYERIEKYRPYDYINWYYTPVKDPKAETH